MILQKNKTQQEKAFRVSRTYPKILRNRKRRIQRRLDPKKVWNARKEPMFEASNIHYEMADKTRAINCGGIGAIHLMARKLGLIKAIDQDLELLKVHLPYHESDHVLNIAYNVLVGGVRLEDIESLRNNECYLDALGAQRIPDPTTAGDFTRRFAPEDIEKLMEVFNRTRKKVWDQQPKGFLKEAVIDIDGTIAPTLGKCKGGMDISYKGIWGYMPLLISLSNTKEPLYLVNRPGNVASHQGAGPWIDRSLELVKPHAGSICLRGDTDFSLTAHFDDWEQQCDFVFGMDANATMKGLAQALPEAHWHRMARVDRHPPKGPEREKPEQVKERIIKEREFLNQRLQSEDVAEFDYRPGKCKKDYRVVVVRKNISVEKGEELLFDDIRYFFYITTRRDMSAIELVQFAHERCDQENLIAQLKGGINALRMPVNDLNSNWAYMVMASLAWSLKAWFGQLMPSKKRGAEIQRMEYRRFLNAFILLPTQIIRQGRKVIFRILGYNAWLPDLFSTWQHLRKLKPL